MADELRDLGLTAKVEEGGVSFQTDARGLYAVNRWSRLAGRIVVRAGVFSASSLEAMAAGIRRIAWRGWVAPHQPLDIAVTLHSSRLRARESVARKVEHAIADALRGPRTEGGRAPRDVARVGVRVVADRAEISIDASGELLHRRGWRLETAEAPIRENLGAAILRLADWVPGEALVDPMCGSGTFSIEAAGIALGLAPGARRSFAFERWPSFDSAVWEQVKRATSPPLDKSAPILTSDREAGAVKAARANATRAGVAGRIALSQLAFEAVVPPAATGLVVLNPPYGARITRNGGSGGIQSIGAVLRSSWRGWRFAILCADPRWIGALGMPSETLAKFSNGGLSVRLIAGRVP